MADICWNFSNPSLEVEGTSIVYWPGQPHANYTCAITGRAVCVNINRSMKAVSSPSGVWGRAPADNEFGAF